MGALQEIFAGNTSTDVITSSHTRIPYDLFTKQQRASNVSKSSPVKTVVVSKYEVDLILDGLGVIRRGCGSVENICSVSGGLCSSNVGRVAGVGNVLEVS